MYKLTLFLKIPSVHSSLYWVLPLTLFGWAEYTCAYICILNDSNGIRVKFKLLNLTFSIRQSVPSIQHLFLLRLNLNLLFLIYQMLS